MGRHSTQFQELPGPPGTGGLNLALPFDLFDKIIVDDAFKQAEGVNAYSFLPKWLHPR